MVKSVHFSKNLYFMISTPPPTKYDELPDYYLGRLIVYEPLSPNGCKWVVYDGNSIIRCPTRTSAVDYINMQVHNATEDEEIMLARASYFLHKTIQSLDAASGYAHAQDKLLLERLAVRLRPFLVDIDNHLLPILQHHDKLPNTQDYDQDKEKPCRTDQDAW